MYGKTLGLIVALAFAGSVAPTGAGTPAQQPASVERRVMAFYYPWYGVPEGPGGAGRTVHWGKIDAANHDIAASTHYPALGAYDSHDPKVIEQHCQWAKSAHIDTFIVSWWGHGDYSDRAMPKILEACERHGLAACLYYETVPKPQTAEAAARDIIRVVEKYGSHKAHLKVDGKPVNQSHRFGLTLKMGWEHPPAGSGLRFVQPDRRLPHVPERFEFPTAGDLRWRPFFNQNHAEYVSLLQLRTHAGDNLGDGAACARLPTGGHVAYAWFGLLNTPQAESLLYDLFTFLVARLGQ